MEEEKENSEEQLTEPESDLPDVLLEFQLEKKEAAINQVLLHLKQLEEKNKEYHKRNDLLKEEQRALIRSMIKQIEEKEKEQDEKELVTRNDVEELLKANWEYVKDKEQLLEDLHSQIEEAKERLAVKQRERDYWLEYKNVGSKTQANEIMNLEQEIKEVKDDLQRTTEYYRNALKAVKEENDSLVDKSLTLIIEQALKKAVEYLDKSSRRDIEENEQLKEEIKIYQKEVSDLKASIQLLEEENTCLVAKLIDSKLQNLRVPSDLFLTEAVGLPEDFPKDEMKVECGEYAEAKTDGEENLRSDTVPCQEEEAFPKIEPKTGNEKPQDSDEELWEKSFTPTLNRLLLEDDFQEYLKLHPLKSKVMFVVGTAMPIHEKPEEMPSTSHREDDIVDKSDRHITAQMIKNLSKEKVGLN
ncbi:PREDICTED: coiled-coil domain-containing protein 83 [Acanthisitta chloris]|nr:PREDICTED: coiled-coil domain-containing protein 83 [Acanthisitta chloris]